MTKVALVGGPEIAKYTVADTMWGHIADISGIGFSFEVIALASEQEVRKFYTEYINDDQFIGFNVALPWKQQFALCVNETNTGGASHIVNTVYKDNGSIRGLNTDPLGIVRSHQGRDFRHKKVLIMGAGGGGRATALHMTQEIGAEVYVYDLVDYSTELPGCKWLKTQEEIRSRKYDLIINATPLGKFYFDRPIEMFASPVDVTTLREISHHDTVIQEMNYFPLDTLFLQLGKVLELHTISGEQMLVFQALESFKSYFGDSLTSSQVDVLLERMQKHILRQESAILECSY